jgi:acyl-CoA thioesterase I
MNRVRRDCALLLTCALVACSGGTGENKPATQGGAPSASASASRSDSTADSTSRAARPVILFLGTSLTAGLGLDPDSAYPARIQRKLDSAGMAFDVVNAGVSGETAAGLLRRLDWVLRRPAAVVVVETGANDGLRGQSVASTKATIGKILDRIVREQPSAKVLLVQMEAPTNLGSRYTAAFREMYPALAREHGVTLLPFLLDSVAGVPALNQADGVHPNDRGERIVTENVWKGLRKVVGG